jgi:predicted dehydrogenase
MASKVFHAPLISAVEGLQLAAVVERSGHSAEAAYPAIATYPTLEAMLSDATLDLIVIATPNATHAALAEQAISAGRNVVVDKPAGITSAQVAGLIAIAQKQKRFLIPFHNRLWDSDFRTLHHLLHEQTLGRIVYLESTFDRWRPAPRHNFWKEDGVTPGGGNLQDLGTHLAYQAFQLFGLPDAVTADIATERDGGITDDSFTLRLRYLGQRLVVNLSSNCLAALPRPRYTVRGTKGNFVKWGLDPQEARLKETGRVADPDWGMEPASAWGTLAVDAAGSMVTHPVKPIPGDYRLFYAGVRDAIQGKTAPPVAAQEAWNSARLLEYAVQSSKERREIPCSWHNKLSE